MLIVQCQACQTRFRVDESRIQGRGARMRCRRCGEAIIVMKDSASRPGSPPPRNLFDLRSMLKQPERRSLRHSGEETPIPPVREPEEGEPRAPETEIATPPEEPSIPREPEAPAAWEPPAEEPAEPAAGEEPPGVESPDETVSLRVTEEAPREAAREADEPHFPAREPEEGEPRGPETEIATPPEEPSVPREPEAPAAWEPPAAGEEPPGVESPDETVSLRVTEEAPREAAREADEPHFPAREPEEGEPRGPETEIATPPEEPSVPREPEAPAAWEPPAAGEEPPGVESPDETVSLRVTEEAPREAAREVDEPHFPAREPEEGEPRGPETEIATPPEEPSVPREPEAPAAWEPPAEEPRAAEEKPLELLLNDAESLDFLNEEYKRAEAEGELDISGILRSDPSPDQEPAEGLPPSTPQEPLWEEPMSERLEAIQRELQEIGGGSPEHAEAPFSSPAAVPSVPPVRKEPPIVPRVAVRPGKIRGGRPSLLPLAILFLLIAGGGAYLGFTPGGQEILRRMVPAMESLWLSGETATTHYSVGNLIGYYEPDTRSGTLFVIKGTVTNQGRKKRSGIRVKAELLGSSGEHIAGKSVFAGNVLSGDELRSFSREAIEKGMANRWGDKLSNLDIAPGKSVPFMVVFFDAPTGIEEYQLEARDGE